MAIARAEDLVARVLAYLAWSGVKLTAEVEREALLVVAEVLGSDSPTFADCLQRLAPHLNVPRSTRPQPCPALRRDSIGYGER